MNSKRFFYVLTGSLVLVIILLVAGVVAGNQVLTKRSKRLVELKVENKTIQTQQSSLVQAKKDIQKYTELNNIAKTIVPQDKDQAKTVREIAKFAEDSNITLKSISFPTSTLGQAPAPTAQPSTDTTKKEASTPAAPAQKAPAITQVKPVDGIPGVYSLEITVSSDPGKPVQYYSLLDFLEKLESNRRTAHVSKVSITPNDKGGLSFVLVLNAYVKP